MTDKDHLKLSLDKEGSFTTQTIGPDGGPISQAYPYRVHLEANRSTLTQDGYIIENSRLQDYFDTLHTLTNCHSWHTSTGAPSCELLACKAVADLKAEIQAGGVELFTITVSIGGSGDTRLSATWNKGEEP